VFQPHTAAGSMPLSWIGKRIGRVKVRKPMGWDKNSLIGKAKAEHARKAK